jgi:hypothetical protein
MSSNALPDSQKREREREREKAKKEREKKRTKVVNHHRLISDVYLLPDPMLFH